MHYTLHQLIVFHKVTETQSITKAAEELHLTQPAVSIQLKKLQDQFEIPLTEVIGRKLYITKFGIEIAQASKRILDEVHAIKYKTHAYKGRLVGNLNITVVSTGKYVMPYFLPEFMKLHQGIDLSIDVTNRTSVLQSLEKNEVDFSLVSILPENVVVNKEELMQNKLFLMGSTIPTSPKGTTPKKMLDKLPLIYREKGSATRRVMEEFITKNGLHPEKKMELTSNEAVKQAVLAGLGYSVMSLSGVRNELERGDLKIIPMKGFPLTTTWHLIWLKDKQFSPVAEAYLEFIRQQKQEIIEKKFEWINHY